jgi:hypothetical protein
MAQKNFVEPEFGPDAEKFYQVILKFLNDAKIPFLIGGTYALPFYFEIDRTTKDLDIFCKPGDYPKILKLLHDDGHKIEIIDDRWLAKVWSKDNKYLVDFIFGIVAGGIWPINDESFKNAKNRKLLGFNVKVTAPEELIVSKMFMMNRKHYSGADISHLILHCGKDINWKLILSKVDPYWEVLLSHILLFRFVYPSEREIIPAWLLKELISRVEHQIGLPTPQDKVSRGTILSTDDFRIDIEKWGFRDVADFRYGDVR